MTTLHVVGLPHTHTTSAYATCAYTQKVRKLGKMLTGRERKVIIYSGEYNDAPCDEHVSLFTEDERRGFFGADDSNDLLRGGISWDPNEPYWLQMNDRAAAAISRRRGRGDILCLIMGLDQKRIVDLIPTMTACEFGVGYEGFFTNSAFESYAHMHHCYGIRRGQYLAAGNPFSGIGDWSEGIGTHAVIPNYFDPDEFPPLDRAAKRRNAAHGDYLLFVGRLINRKGAHIAGMIASELGMKLLVAGPGMTEAGPGYVVAENKEMGEYVRVEAPGLEYVGVLGFQERSELMTGAKALLAPTSYLEPFGGVAVEAMLCGTPAVTTDWGAFTETVQEGVSGYRFRSVQGGVEAVQKAMLLDRDAVRDYALGRYSLGAVAPMYERWFDALEQQQQ